MDFGLKKKKQSMTDEHSVLMKLHKHWWTLQMAGSSLLCIQVQHMHIMLQTCKHE